LQAKPNIATNTAIRNLVRICKLLENTAVAPNNARLEVWRPVKMGSVSDGSREERPDKGIPVTYVLERSAIMTGKLIHGIARKTIRQAD
jgi:hypothetical protein